MKIGIPREVKNKENRVAGTPATARMLVQAGHEVLVQAGLRPVLIDEAAYVGDGLYKALRPDAQPRFDTVSRVCAALGVKLVAQAVHA